MHEFTNETLGTPHLDIRWDSHFGGESECNICYLWTFTERVKKEKKNEQENSSNESYNKAICIYRRK